MAPGVGAAVASAGAALSLKRNGSSMQQDLVAQGMRIMLESVLKDLEAPEEARQLQALTALLDLTKNTRSSGGGALAEALRTAGGFARLVGLVDAVRSPRAAARPGAALPVALGAVGALSALTLNNADNRRAAIQAGAVPALCNLLGGDEEGSSPIPGLALGLGFPAAAAPPYAKAAGSGDAAGGPEMDGGLAVLRALYALCAPDNGGSAVMELFGSGGVHALVRLLRLVMGPPEADVGGAVSASEAAAAPRRALWLRELLALLEPLARRSRLVGHLLMGELGALARLLASSDDPLSLSLALDILDEMLAHGERRRVAQLVAQEGVLASLVRAMHVKGVGNKAVLLLAGLAGDLGMLALLRALLQPRDLACLVDAAVAADSAEDLDGQTCGALLAALVGGEQLGVLTGLLRARCLGACLGLPTLSPLLLGLATSNIGLALLANLGPEDAESVGVAAATLLPHFPDCAPLLARPGPLTALISAVLNEAESVPSAPIDGIAGASTEEESASGRTAASVGTPWPATSALEIALSCLPQESDPRNAPPLEGFSGSTGSSPMSGESGIMAAPAVGPAGQAAAGANGVPGMGNGASSGFGGPIAGAGPDEGQTYDTMTFRVGGQEFYALAWVLERSSRAIARTMRHVPDPTATAIVIPDIPGLSPERMYAAFVLAVEWAYTREIQPEGEAALMDLWAVAASLQMPELQAWCEAGFLQAGLLESDAHLASLLALTTPAKRYGVRLRVLCVRAALGRLRQLVVGGVLGALCRAGHRQQLQDTMTTLLRMRLQEIERSLSPFVRSGKGPDAAAFAQEASAARAMSALQVYDSCISLASWNFGDKLPSPQRSGSDGPGGRADSLDTPQEASESDGQGLFERVASDGSVATPTFSGSRAVSPGGKGGHYRFEDQEADSREREGSGPEQVLVGLQQSTEGGGEVPAVIAARLEFH